jgi:hypothetical protein
MKSFDRILDTCLEQIAAGQSTIDQCLDENPQHRQELEPLLRAAEKVAGLRTIEPTAAFRQRGRRALEAHMSANPRPATREGFFARLFSNPTAARRLATSMAAVALALVSTGTVLAQSALPGDPLYGWKLQTEQLWRPFSGEKTQYELHLSERRAEEYLAVYQRPELATSALQNYTKSLTELLIQLELRPDQVLTVYEGLLDQQEDLVAGGLTIPELDAVLRTLTPTDTGQAPDDSGQSPPATDTEEGGNSAGGEGSAGNTVQDDGQNNVLATGIPGLLQGVATAIAPILNP